MGKYIYGRNTVRSALQEGRVSKVFVQSSFHDQIIIELCQKKKIPVLMVENAELNQMAQGSHQGIVAEIAKQYDFVSLDNLISNAKKNQYPLLIILDGINDPHNLGAIMRSADAFGAQGIIIGKHHQVGLTSTVAKVSTGAIEYVPVAQVSNLNQAIKILKNEGFWVVSSDGSASLDYREVDYQCPIAIIVGSEGEGISKLVISNSDFVVKIPMIGHVNSLNASVATAIMLSEIYNNRFPILKGEENGKKYYR